MIYTEAGSPTGTANMNTRILKLDDMEKNRIDVTGPKALRLQINLHEERNLCLQKKMRIPFLHC